MSVAIEAVLAGVVAGLDLDQADVEHRVHVGRKRQRAGNVDEADHLLGFNVIKDDVAFADLHSRPGCRDLAAFPGCGGRPGAALGGADELRVRRRLALVFMRPRRRKPTAGAGTRSSPRSDARRAIGGKDIKWDSNGVGGKRGYCGRFRAVCQRANVRWAEISPGLPATFVSRYPISNASGYPLGAAGNARKTGLDNRAIYWHKVERLFVRYRLRGRRSRPDD